MSTNIILKDTNNILWNIGVLDNGNITSTVVATGTSSIPIFKDYQGGLTAWKLGITIAGAITTTNVGLTPSLSSGIPLLSSPSNILYSLVVSAAGAYTTIKSAAKTAGYIITTAQSLLNDATGLLWNFALMLPFLQLAFQDLSQELEINQVPITRQFTVILQLPIGNTVISFGTVPGLPQNLITPVSLEERLVGQDNTRWIELDERTDPVDAAVGTYLRYWWWDGVQINTLGSLNAEDIKLKYVGGLYIPQASTDYINPAGSELYLIHRTAYHAANSIGFDHCAISAEKNGIISLERFIRFLVQSRQGLPVRRKGYRRSVRGFKFR